MSFHSRLWLWDSIRLGAGTKLGRVSGAPESRADIQRDRNRQEKWAVRNLIKFNQGKCQVLPLGMNNPRHQNMPGAVWFRSIFAEKDEGVLVDTTFDRSQQSPYLLKRPTAPWAALGKVSPAGPGK